MAETRGRDGEAVEVKSAGKKMVRFGAFWDLFGCFLNALKSFSQPPSPIIRPFWMLFYSLKHHVYGVGKSCRPPPPKKKRRKKKEDNRSNKIYRNEGSTWWLATDWLTLLRHALGVGLIYVN